MLSRLYEEGFLNYQAFILKYYKTLELTELEAVVLIKMLDLCKSTKKLKSSKLASEMKMKKAEVEQVLNNLMIKKIYTIDFTQNENGVMDEKISFESLFNKLDDCLKTEAVLRVEDELKELISIFEREFNRALTPAEYAVIEDFYKVNGFQIDEIKQALKKAVMQNKISLSFVERMLIQTRENKLKPKKQMDPSKKQALDKAFDLI